jgi:hypothetical protein
MPNFVCGLTQRVGVKISHFAKEEAQQKQLTSFFQNNLTVNAGGLFFEDWCNAQRSSFAESLSRLLSRALNKSPGGSSGNPHSLACFFL